MPGREPAVLAPLLRRLGLPETLLSPLLAHAAAVRWASPRLGLVSPADLDLVARRHTADSLLFAVARAPRAGERWVDAGSGAGFPGLVLACCYPECLFTLAEPLKRRAGFLELQVAALGLANVRVQPVHIERLDGGFDVAVSRALARPDAALGALIAAVRPGGEAMVAAGPRAPVPPGATRVEIGRFGVVDSPGVLFMMTRS